jgi:serine/threonine-protein kinase
MSPEQARGKTVDRRADIWAWGAVLYEMLTGRRAFAGESVSDTLAAVLMREPDWSALPAETPAPVVRVLKRCLERDARTRFHDVADARIDMDERPEPGAAAAPQAPARRSRSVIPWLAALVLAVAAAAGWWRVVRQPAASPPRLARLAVPLAETDRIPSRHARLRSLARRPADRVRLGRGDGRRVYLRALDSAEAKPIAGTDAAFSPFFSPDGRSVGFFAGAS